MVKQVEKKRDSLLGGTLMVLIGLIALASQFIDLDSIPNLGLLILPSLGALFLFWGMATREAGPIIPGGILSGIGLGVFLNAGSIELGPELDGGGLFMLSFALGWLLITVLTAVFTSETHWWPLIPAAIMGLIGGTVLFGGLFETILSFLGTYWPAALIILGLSILIQTYREKPQK